MSRDPLPEPWRSVLERKGVHSKRGLASKTGISPQTAKRLIDGEGKPSHETVAAVADELFDGDRNRVWELAGLAREDHGDWQIPASLTSQLDEEQRKAVLAVVRAMLPSDARRGDGDVTRDAAPIGLRNDLVFHDKDTGARIIVELKEAHRDSTAAAQAARRWESNEEGPAGARRVEAARLAMSNALAHLDPELLEDEAARPDTT